VILTVDGSPRDFQIETVIVAGYTGRDRAAVMHHIAELAEIGIPPPTSVPFYWRFPPWLGMQLDTMIVTGAETSGETELCLIVDGDELFVTLASDHTDRAAEAIDIGMSKAICPKVIGREAWPVAAVDGRWGELVLRSWITENGVEVLYQDGSCSSLVPPLDLLAGVPFEKPRCFALTTGTVPVIGGIRPASRFRGELHDPAADRRLRIAYDIISLETGRQL
jgi:hypothetical protein